MKFHFSLPQLRGASKRRRHTRSSGRRSNVLLRVEGLEERAVPTTWTGAAGNQLWFDRMNWDTLTVPGSGDMVTIPENSPQVLLAEVNGNPTTIAGLTFSGVMEMRTSLIVMGPMTWTRGTIFGDGANDSQLQVRGVTLSGPDPKSLHGNVDIENGGVMNWSGGDILASADPSGGPTFANGSTVNLNDDVSFHGTFSPDPQFMCSGTLRKQGGTGTSTISNLTASGPVEVDTGSLVLDGTGSLSGPVSLAAGTNLSVSTFRGYTLADTTVSGAGTLSIAANAILRYSGSVTVQNLSLVTNGLLTVPTGQTPSLTVSGSMDWTGGTISGGHVTINGTLNIHGTDDKFLNSCTVDNAGLATWADAGAVVDPATGGPVVWNNLAGATFDVQNQAPFISAGNVTFFNAGTFRKSTATDTSLTATFNNSGLLDIAAGGILDSSTTYHGQRYTSRAYNWQAGAADTGTGTVLISAATTLTVVGDSSVPNLTLVAGATIVGAATLTVDGLFSWTGGTLTGAGTLVMNGGVNISGPDTKTLTGWTLVNPGIAVWTGTGGIVGTNAAWDNLAGSTFQDGATGQLSGNGGGGMASTHFNNAGLYEATITAPLFHLLDVLFDNSGVVQVDPGLVLSIHDSTLTLEDGSSEGGGGSLLVGGSTQIIVTGNPSIENVTLQTDGETVSGFGTLTITGLLHWDAGTMANGHIGFQGPISIGANPVSLKNFIFDNFGTVTWTATNPFMLLDSASIWNNLPGSLFDARTDGTVEMSPPGSPEPQFNNAGIFRKSAGTGTMSLQQVTFTNMGSVEVLSGTLDLLGDFPNFSGTTLTFGSYFMHGTLRFPNADIRTNAAAIVLDGPAAGIRDTGIPMTHDALANFANNADTGSFTVQGARTFATGGDFSNAGTLTIAAGSTFTANGMYDQTAGLTILAGGTLTAVSAIDIEGGELDGFGTVNGNVLNAAVVNVGGPLAAGMLTINGDYTQTAAGNLLVQIGDPNLGTDFSQLNVSGQATLDGTLTVTLIDGFIPASGDAFEVLMWSSASGAFGTLAGDGSLFDPVPETVGLYLVAH